MWLPMWQSMTSRSTLCLSPVAGNNTHLAKQVAVLVRDGAAGNQAHNARLAAVACGQREADGAGLVCRQLAACSTGRKQVLSHGQTRLYHSKACLVTVKYRSAHQGRCSTPPPRQRSAWASPGPAPPHPRGTGPSRSGAAGSAECRVGEGEARFGLPNDRSKTTPIHGCSIHICMLSIRPKGPVPLHAQHQTL